MCAQVKIILSWIVGSLINTTIPFQSQLFIQHLITDHTIISNSCWIQEEFVYPSQFYNLRFFQAYGIISNPLPIKIPAQDFYLIIIAYKIHVLRTLILKHRNINQRIQMYNRMILYRCELIFCNMMSVIKSTFATAF